MTTLSDGSELTYTRGPEPAAYTFYVTPPGGTRTPVFSIDDYFYGMAVTLEHIDVFDGYVAITAFTTEGRRSQFTQLDTYVLENDGIVARGLHDEAAWRSGTFESVDLTGPDDVTVTWVRANNYGAGNTQYGAHQVIVENGDTKPDTFVNHAPIVKDINFTVEAGRLIGADFGNFDPDFDLLKYVVVDGPAHGSVTQITRFDGNFYPFPQADYVGDVFYHSDFLEGNIFRYTPDPGFVGKDSFTFYGSDGQASSAVATVTINYLPPPGQAQYMSLGAGNDVAKYSGSDHPVLVAAQAGDDNITGGQYADSLNGAAGNDLLHGGAGDDRLTGGAGKDRMEGGAGNDTFYFNAGDLAKTSTAADLDHIIDFHGAGEFSGAEQDYLLFDGFGEDATLSFIRFGSSDHLKQLYKVTDPDSPDHPGYLMLQMAEKPTVIGGTDFAFI